MHTEAYKSIKAPDNMLGNILAADVKKRAVNYKALISCAACVILLAAILPCYVGLTEPAVVISPASPVFARLTDTVIPISLELGRASTVSVNTGDINVNSDEKLKGNAELVWTIPPTASQPYILSIRDGFRTTDYSLSYNEKNDSWTIVKN